MLRLLIAASQDDGEDQSLLAKIDPVTRTVIDPKLRNPFAYLFYIAHKPGLETVQAHLNSSLSPFVPQCGEPLDELRSEAKISHD